MKHTFIKLAGSMLVASLTAVAIVATGCSSTSTPAKLAVAPPQVSPSKIQGTLKAPANAKVFVWVKVRDPKTKKVRLVYARYNFKTGAYIIDSPSLKPAGLMTLQASINKKTYTLVFPKSKANPAQKANVIPPSQKKGSTVKPKDINLLAEEPTDATGADLQLGDTTVNEASAELAPATNPMDQIDTDGDGQPDFEDADSDGDGESNDKDADDAPDTDEAQADDEQAETDPDKFEKQFCEDYPTECDGAEAKVDEDYCDNNPCTKDCVELVKEFAAQFCK